MGNDLDIIEDAEVVETQSSEVDFVPDTQPLEVEGAEQVFELSSEDHRKKIINCVKEVQGNLAEICRLLFEAKRMQRYVSWGFSTFKDYAHRELGFKYSKANSYANMWQHVGLKTPHLFERMMTVGWDKANEISRVIDEQNADHWIEKANNLNADDLKKEVRAYITSRVPKDAEEAIKSEFAEDFDENEPAITRNLHHKTFALTYDNLQTVNDAIVRVKQVNPEIQSESECISMVCAEYNATVCFDGDNSQDYALELIKRVCLQQGWAPIVIKKEDKSKDQEEEIIYGAEDLKSFSMKLLEDDE